ncbi:hypothetical protein CFOL_v3_29496 [Cephalotus follicularis]|uniref:Uncharacterized protein n=1 Tax=Cephalotus follicularis TaxID=3775 RepID=A0A1Q3D192_CEPFO|nr:hypothetical protein CFOL_v3_29496 [Cephalotus follicularis]
MESETNNNITKTTNWTIAGGGSIVNSVTFESSFTSTINTNEEVNDDATTADSTPKSALIMHPPSPYPPPCEITVTFAQRHEVKQVYVRSSARVYEIYYASDLQSDSEYLCTVRCGLAARDEEVLHTPDIEVADLAFLKGIGGEVDEKQLKSDGSFSPNEDGWVEIKVPDTYPRRSTQDFYEATAEISDAHPCISLTIRLLSLQDKGCVFVDEVYMFGDPVNSACTENQVGQTENPAGSCLMAMLMPTLLQLSKTKGVSGIQDKQTEPGSTDSPGGGGIEQEPQLSVDQQEVKFQGAVSATAKLAQLPLQVPDKESKPDVSCNHIEKVLDQLVSRVSRIEDLFLRFEESMLKPIRSIDARLQQVEQQVEMLSSKSQNSELCTRISAPEFSCHESDEKSFYDDGFDNYNMGESGKDEQDFLSANLPDDNSDVANANQTFPSLVISAPEFSNADDEEENHELDSVTGSPDDKPRYACSIDDALASALAGFLSSTIETQKYTQALAVKAPDFLNEDGKSDRKDTPKAQCEVTVVPFPSIDTPKAQRELTAVPFVFIDGTAGTECVEDLLPTSSNISSLEREETANTSLNDENCNKICDGFYEFDEQYQHHVAGEEGDFLGSSIEDSVSLVKCDMKRTNSCQLLEDKENGEGSDGDISSLDKGVIWKRVYEDQIDDGSDAMQERAVVRSDFAAAKEVKQRFNKDLLRDALEISCAASAVDFGIPILDVRFISQGNSNIKSTLEALFVGMPISNDESSLVEGNVYGRATGESNLISVEDIDVTDPAPVWDSNFLLNFDYNNVSHLPLSVDDEKMQGYQAFNNEKLLATSLI